MLQVLRDGVDQAGGDRRLEAEGGHAECSGRDLRLQARQPDDVRLGDPRPTAVGDGLRPGKRAECQLDQQVRGAGRWWVGGRRYYGYIQYRRRGTSNKQNNTIM